LAFRTASKTVPTRGTVADGDDDGGIRGDERVSKQVSVHDIGGRPQNVGTDIDGDSGREHSAIHVGELHWNKNPTQDSSRPSTEVVIELDSYVNAASEARVAVWRERVRSNYRLYGIGVRFVADDMAITDSQLRYPLDNPSTIDLPGAEGAVSPFWPTDLAQIDTAFSTNQNDMYMFLGDRAADIDSSDLVSQVLDQDLFFPEQTGVSLEPPVDVVDLTAVFTEAHQDERVHVPNRLNLNRDEEIRALTAKTAVHEIGHQLSIGEADDNGGEEIYSGSDGDSTNESVINPRTNDPVLEWSVMSGGHSSDQYIEPINGRYTPFSIEELMSLDIG